MTSMQSAEPAQPVSPVNQAQPAPQAPPAQQAPSVPARLVPNEPPNELPPWLRIDLVRPVTVTALLVALGIGVLGDLALRSGLVGLAGALLVLATSAALLACRWLRTRQARLLVALAPLFGGWLALRTSGWLLPLDLVAAFGLLALGVSLSAGGTLANLPFTGLLARAWHFTLHAIMVPQALMRLARNGRWPARGSVTWAVVRGMLLAMPVVLLLGLLLMSGDAVFASMVSVEFDGGDFFRHLFAIALAAWVFLALVRVASAAEPTEPAHSTARLGAVEALVVLGSVVVLFGGFAVAQAIAVIAGSAYVQQTTGVTYAEYARSGFFQLLWVAVLTIGGLLVLRAVTDRRDARSARRFAVLSCVVCGLTLLIVAVAIRRLTLYSDVYGLTMLRLYCTIFAVWIGVVLVLLTAWLAGVHGARAWFPAAAGACGLALLLGLNVANPEALVARTNLQREAPLDPDTRYLTSHLSDDAVPVIAELLPGLDAETRDDIREQLCGDSAEGARFTGWAAWNLSHARATTERNRLCG